MSYLCQIEDCGKYVNIRSTIKEGEHKGKKVCPFCKLKYEQKKKTPKVSKVKERRKLEREGLPEFFKESVEEMKQNPFCENCGGKINVEYNPFWNIAHILPKSVYKSVMTHPENKLFLCTSKDNTDNDCHREFDTNISNMISMKCFTKAKIKFEKFKSEILERGKIFYIFDDNQ